jgi:transmembrane sensor
MKDSPRIVKEAAQWSAILDADDVKAAELAACESWCAQDPLHRKVFEHMRAFGTSIDSLGEIGRRTLARMGRGPRDYRTRRRVTLSGLAAVAMAAAGWLASQSDLARQQWPDYRTGRGETRTLMLSDASTLVLDTDSAVSTEFEKDIRRITLHDGRLFTSVTRDPDRPFVVKTSDGTVTALGTAFTVTRGGSGTEIEVVASRVRACTHDGGACLELGPGERALITASGATRIPGTTEHPDLGWTEGWLTVDDRPLAEVLTELARYSRHPVRFDEHSLSDLRITGSYPLDDAERAVKSLAVHFGLGVETSADGAIWVRPEP